MWRAVLNPAVLVLAASNKGPSAPDLSILSGDESCLLQKLQLKQGRRALTSKSSSTLLAFRVLRSHQHQQTTTQDMSSSSLSSFISVMAPSAAAIRAFTQSLSKRQGSFAIRHRVNVQVKSAPTNVQDQHQHAPAAAPAPSVRASCRVQGIVGRFARQPFMQIVVKARARVCCGLLERCRACELVVDDDGLPCEQCVSSCLKPAALRFASGSSITFPARSTRNKGCKGSDKGSPLAQELAISQHHPTPLKTPCHAGGSERG